MESIKLIRDELAHIKSLSDTVLLRALKDKDEFARMRIEIDKLNSIIDELRDENERLKREAKGGEA